MSARMDALRDACAKVIDVNAAISLLHWDLEIYMPPKGAVARGEQIATLSAISHRMLTDPTIGHALAELLEDDSLSLDDATMVREMNYDYETATKLPESFITRFAEEQSAAYHAWFDAREKGDYKVFQPHLETLVDMLRQKADLIGYEGSPYNALMDEYERGMTAERVTPIFQDLATRQRDLIERIVQSPNQPNLKWLEQRWDPQAQWDFSMDVLRDIGYNFDAGRQDKSVHPFTTVFDLYDVRVTTRIDEHDLFSGLTGSVHEGGHALYEQGFLEADRRTIFAQAPSLGLHESQSRMWENIIGRSLPFWEYYESMIKQYFPGHLDAVNAHDIFRAINAVGPSYIRTEADECTYNLHIILRYEIELALIEGTMKVADLPEVWNAKTKEYLGLDIRDDREGCLQDIHWSHGSMGYFPTYTLGNLYASQLFEQIEIDLPNLWEEVGEGNFSSLLTWLNTHVHEPGCRKLAPQIIEDATGAAPSSEPYMRYLESKYGALYSL